MRCIGPIGTLLVLAVTTLGCYDNAEQFNEAYVDTYCQAAAACDYVCDEEVLLEDLAEEAGECEYDARSARSCMRALRRAKRTGDCDIVDGPPSPCGSVYSGERCNALMPMESASW